MGQTAQAGEGTPRQLTDFLSAADSTSDLYGGHRYNILQQWERLKPPPPSFPQPSSDNGFNSHQQDE